MAGETPDRAQGLAQMEDYSELDGEIICRYATAFAQVGQSLMAAQRTTLHALRSQILGSLVLPSGAY
jgi:hypothetical protein